MRTSRREFLQQTAAISLVPLASTQALTADVSAERSALENELLRAVFDVTSGALLELSNQQTGRRFQGRRELANSFVMVVPLPERLLHVLNGNHQKTTSYQCLPNRLEVTWDGLESEYVQWVDYPGG
jgi:hypothetical protein